MGKVLKYLNNMESYVCRTLLSVFVCLLFIQVVRRGITGNSYSWIEEVSTFLFVWFVFLGASYAAKMAAHNRMTFQFRFLPKSYIKWIEGFADLFWLGFNFYFIYLSLDFIFNKMNKFQSTQTLGGANFHLSWVYIILPIAFTLMSFRILQVNYIRLVKGEDVHDPGEIDLEELAKQAEKDRKDN